MDFTITIYKTLINSLQHHGFEFDTFREYASSISQPQKSTANNKLIILRHDVDDKPQNSLRFARIQASSGIVGTYYFRIVPKSYNQKIAKEIVELGHEVGYHYESMDTCKGNVDKAYDDFCKNLEKFNKLTEIKTISMHGSPMSPYDNRAIWEKYDYQKLGIIAEPYFDIDFNKLYYLTETGRRWDGHLYNLRDKATMENPVTNSKFLKLRYHSTQNIIDALDAGTFPKQAMLNFHPQRWSDKLLPWIKEFVWQNVKNQGKHILIKIRK